MKYEKHRDLRDWFNHTPKRLKNKVKYFINDLGYDNASDLWSHILECYHIRTNVKVLDELIKYYKDLK